jgi:predicted metal-dependent peptidase
MPDDKKPKFDLNMHTAYLLMREPFFAALSRRIDKIRTDSVPTAGVRVNPDTAQFELFYNPKFMGALSDEHKMGVLMHEFYHIIFEHVTTRKPEGGIRQIDNIAMDLAINGLPEMSGKLPCEADPGPVLTEGGEPMKGCLPGEGKFAHLPANQTYEWYLAELEKMQEEAKQNGEGDPYEGEDSFDVHDGFGEGGGNQAANDIAKERLKDAIKKAAEEADKAGNWGSVSQSMRQAIKERLQSKVDWKKVLLCFVRTSRRAEKRSTPRKIDYRLSVATGKKMRGKRVRRRAKIAISIDQSGSVDDGMLAAFYSELDNLAKLAEFTVIPFDTRVAEDKVYVWKKGERRKWERVLHGGTSFDAPTRYVNERDFDGHLILTDMCAPKPIASRCQRLWMTTSYYARNPYFSTNEIVVAIDRK